MNALRKDKTNDEQEKSEKHGEPDGIEVYQSSEIEYTFRCDFCEYRSSKKFDKIHKRNMHKRPADDNIANGFSENKSMRSDTENIPSDTDLYCEVHERSINLQPKFKCHLCS